ncbi:hypothetical protein FB565_007417 [Actinoplanes lutulentus]|uniref:Secreted protein n=1 Tax=Actinoplanes lutulentus TaxID=1287878 RepID=A0A327Z0J7_9ACTN|nr:DUF6493 family protein [Actinoplanes lutulentus]MBB2947646.1 hypothetical protein [Actinoplanes lutulentus]RAK27702.1 hypothetical protein B0I29_12285 [Actinoplanes lutulentus]
MSLTWTDLDDLARRPAYGQITSRLLAMSEAERLAFVAELDSGMPGGLAQDRWESRDHYPASGYALAVIACAPSAARAATMLTRRGMRDGWGEVPAARVTAIAAAREITWLADLGARLAVKLPARDVWAGQWGFVAAMLDGSPSLAPRTEGFVRGWLTHLHDSQGNRSHPTAEVFGSSPYLDVLLPAVFETDGLGGALTGSYWTGSEWTAEPWFPGVVARLVAEGRLDRARILAATVDRLVRGDRPAWLRPFALLHDALAPTVDELAPAALDYARLLTEAPSAIAGLGQRALRVVDDAGLLDVETVLETSGAVLLRTEKVLVKAQLSWLERVARREPDRVGEVVEAVAVAFGHPTFDVQERALTLIGRHIARVDAETVTRLVDAAAGLGGDLPARAHEMFGVVLPPSEVAGMPPVLVTPAPVASMPPPISDASELAAEIAALLHDETAVVWERVLAALVALPAAGVPLDGVLRPVLERYSFELTDPGWHGQLLRTARLGDAMRAIVNPATSNDVPAPGALREAWLIGAGEQKSLRGGPGSVLGLRIREVADRFAAQPVAELMATPTAVNGSLDAAVLLERLLRAEAAGREPWPVDVEQALLRVPRDVDAEVVTRAAELTSVAGRQFADWLKGGGLPDPVSTRFEQVGKDGRYAYGGRPPVTRRVVARLDQARAGGEGTLLEAGLVNLDRSNVPVYYPHDFSAPADITAVVLPQHREVTAAWVLPALASLADMDQRGVGPLLPLLAECSGPIGPAMTLAVAYVLGARHDTDRLSAVDAFLILAAGEDPIDAADAGAGRIDAAAGAGGGIGAAAGGGGGIGAGVGAELGSLCADGTLKLTRVVPGLADIHRGGAAGALWELILAALPQLLPHAPRGLPDLLQLATQVAGDLAARDLIPELAATAARPGSSRLTKEARRLQTVLAGPA